MYTSASEAMKGSERLSSRIKGAQSCTSLTALPWLHPITALPVPLPSC